MHRKKLLTSVLCLVLAMASYAVGGAAIGTVRTDFYPAAVASAAEEDGGAVVSEQALSSKSQSSSSETQSAETKVKASQTTEAQTQAAETQTKAAEAQTQAAETQTKAAEAQAQAAETQTKAAEAETQTAEAQTSAAEMQAQTAEAQTSAAEVQAQTAAAETQMQATEAQTATTETQAQATEAQTAATETQAAEAQTTGTSAADSEGRTESSDPGTESGSGTEAETETASSEGLPSETVAAGESETEAETPESESDTEESTSGKKKSKKEKETEEETEEEPESETSGYTTNAELIAAQNIIVPEVRLEFRFTQIEEAYAIVSSPEGASVLEEKAETAREVGVMEYYGLCYILKDEGDGWYYIESGNVRGFVRAEDVVTEEVAERIINVKGLESLHTARLLVARTENEAFAYTRTTVQEVIADKVYALAGEETTIYEQRKDSSRAVGTLAEGALCYILADAESEWVFVESGDARGFVLAEVLVTGEEAERIVAQTGEDNMELAQVLIEPADNKSCYYTVTSVQAASQAATIREAIVNFALQFVGNPYVWGGTSLTNGADCSGFVQSVYAHFGYSLPRVAAAQSGYGTQIPVSYAEPGDLIFYAKKGNVYHVSIYVGDGKAVHAYGTSTGIIVSEIADDAVWATRIITD